MMTGLSRHAVPIRYPDLVSTARLELARFPAGTSSRRVYQFRHVDERLLARQVRGR